MRASPIGQRLFRRPPAVMASGTTWSSANSNAGWTLSSGNLEAVSSVSSGDIDLFGSAAKASGTYTATITAAGANAIYIGISATLKTTTTWLGGQADCCTYSNNGSLWFGAAQVQSGLATYTTADVITIAYDGTSVQFKKNGTNVGTAINVSSAIATAYPAASTNGSGWDLTANFGSY